MSFTKADIVKYARDRLYEEDPSYFYTRGEVEDIIEVVIEAMKETLGRGEDLKVSGLGKFSVNYKRERLGRDPQTGAPITISARRVVTFKPSPKLKRALNP